MGIFSWIGLFVALAGLGLALAWVVKKVFTKERVAHLAKEGLFELFLQLFK